MMVAAARAASSLAVKRSAATAWKHGVWIGAGSESAQGCGGVFDLLGVDGDGWFAESCPELVDVDVEVPVAEEPAGGVVADFAGVWVDA